MSSLVSLIVSLMVQRLQPLRLLLKSIMSRRDTKQEELRAANTLRVTRVALGIQRDKSAE